MGSFVRPILYSRRAPWRTKYTFQSSEVGRHLPLTDRRRPPFPSRREPPHHRRLVPCKTSEASRPARPYFRGAPRSLAKESPGPAALEACDGPHFGKRHLLDPAAAERERCPKGRATPGLGPRCIPRDNRVTSCETLRMEKTWAPAFAGVTAVRWHKVHVNVRIGSTLNGPTFG
jgi:hypothetical protein